MIQHAIIHLILLKVGQVGRAARVYDVVPHQNRPLPDASSLLKPLEVGQVEAFQVVDEDEVERAVVFYELLLGLDGAEVDGDACLEAAVLMQLARDAGYQIVGLNRVHMRF